VRALIAWAESPRHHEIIRLLTTDLNEEKGGGQEALGAGSAERREPQAASQGFARRNTWSICRGTGPESACVAPAATACMTSNPMAIACRCICRGRLFVASPRRFRCSPCAGRDDLARQQRDEMALTRRRGLHCVKAPGRAFRRTPPKDWTSSLPPICPSSPRTSPSLEARLLVPTGASSCCVRSYPSALPLLKAAGTDH
jgi:hypothetical protein